MEEVRALDQGGAERDGMGLAGVLPQEKGSWDIQLFNIFRHVNILGDFFV